MMAPSSTGRGRVKALLGVIEIGQVKCAIPGCGRETMRSAGKGLAEMHCRYHVQFRARHGSHWYPTYKAADLKPYLAVAAEWIKEHRAEVSVSYPLMGLRGLLDGAGRAEPAMDIKRQPAAFRARVAFARLREANVKPERLMAIHMAVGALIEDDRGSHRIKEFHLVQTAKAVHRLASGTHRQWERAMHDGTIRPLHLHAYPKSSGIVLRVIGREIDEICGGVAERVLEEVRAARLAKFGPHPSHLPGWKPLWVRRREAAKREAAKRK
jgi:hypothetical protein